MSESRVVASSTILQHFFEMFLSDILTKLHNGDYDRTSQLSAP